MKYDNKIAVVVKNSLLIWQKLNVSAFLASSIAIKFPETHGKEFINSKGSTYLPFIKQPILIYGADTTDEIDRAFKRAKDRNLAIGIYTEPLFSTRTESENLEELAKCDETNQILVGIVIYGENKKVNKALNGLKFHD